MKGKDKTKFLCASSLFNISKDLKSIDDSASNVCLTLAKTLMKSIDTSKIGTQQIHGNGIVHKVEDDVSAEVQRIIDEIRKENG